MPDTFYSWFLVTELHVWILMVRTMAEGEEGRFVRNNIVEAMWEDVSTRVKKLEVCTENTVLLPAKLQNMYTCPIVLIQLFQFKVCRLKG
jgi:hypothetical protein